MKNSRRPTGTGFARLREPTFPAPFDRLSDPQIPLTRPGLSPRRGWLARSQLLRAATSRKRYSVNESGVPSGE
jgi:hypothetical protein